jgi:8-oxo-dGTP pyrophosphatase MutT (NUDIX family)
MNAFRTRAGLAVFTADRTAILIVRGAKSGKWSLPKGKVEANETSIQAAIRECQEETGLTPSEYTLLDKLFVKNHCSIYEAQMLGACRPLTVDPNRVNEIGEIRWVPLDALDTYIADANDSLRYFIARIDSLLQ